MKESTTKAIAMLVMLITSSYGCREQPMLQTTANPVHDGWHARTHRSPYGEGFQLDCSFHNTTNLIIQHHNQCLKTTKINDTAIRSTLKPDLGKYLYTCLQGDCDSNQDVCGHDHCCGQQIAVDVEPAMTVTAPDIRSKIGSDQYLEYFVSMEEPYDVYCSSNNRNALSIKKYLELNTDFVNETTLVHHAFADGAPTDERLYQCVDYELQGYQQATVIMDYPPVANEFRCILHHWRQLECSWQSYSELNKFKVYHKFSYKVYISGRYEFVPVELLLCADESGNQNISCNWFNRYRGEAVLVADGNCNFTIQTCNDIYCNNQTFDISCNAITKLEMIYNFRVLNTSSNGVFLAWSFPSTPHQFLGNKNFTYNVEYRLKVFGENWRSTNTSTAICDHSTCEYFLRLPYPDAEYEGRVSMRFLEADDAFQSEPSFIESFSTRTSIRDAECCSVKSNFTCQLCEFKEYTVKNSMALINLKSNLKKKLEKIEIYTRILRDLESVKG